MISTFKWNPGIKHSGQSMILQAIVRNLKIENISEVKVDLYAVADSLSNLKPRMRKAIMEIIMDYSDSNPEIYTVMGKQGCAPYAGLYENKTNSTSFDLLKFPDPLIIILSKFIDIQEKHR